MPTEPRPRRLPPLLLGLALACSCQAPPPLTLDFERESDLDKLAWKCRTLFRLSGRHATSGARSLEIEFHPSPDRAGRAENYPGLALDGFDPDWSGRTALVFDAHNPEETPLTLSVRIDDREGPEPAERFGSRITLAPGANRVALPLASLLTSGTGRRLDLRAIRQVILYLANPREPHTLYLDRVRLE